MPLTKIVKIDDKDVTVRELRVREVYNADVSPPEQELLSLYLLFDIDYPLILAACDLSAVELLELYPSDLDRIAEAYREINRPLLAKPLVAEGRQRQKEALKRNYSELFAISLQQVTDQEPGTTP